MLQHQITQSPARLGLTNPNSPSIQNPTPSKLPASQPPPQQRHLSSNVSASAVTSATLQSLLPPLPRAQSLLLQMASLTSKLFEVSPNRSLWLSAFRGSFPSFLSSEVQSNPPPPLESQPASTKEVIALFTSLQTQLFEAVQQLQEILDLQDSRQKLAREIRGKDGALLAFTNKLKETETVLDMLVDDYSDYRRTKRSKVDDNGDNEKEEEEEEEEGEQGSCSTTVASQLKLSDILSYAHRISYTTFAPPEFGAGQGPLRGALPPAPQEEQMRASQLYNFADLDVGLPKRDDTTKEITIEPIIDEPLPAVEPDALAGFLAQNIKIPPGWKPGMPVELPSDLPVPPPGWKPGDPVSLPPFPAPRGEEPQRLRPVVPPTGLHKPPEPIQVRHVELDILDADDDSSDYMSDEASSDDED